jgi:hypothetical protein
MKSHVRINKTQPNTPLCSYRNSRAWKELPANTVLSPEDFRAVQSSCRCMLCDDLYLIKRNEQRRMKGLKPVKTAFEEL